MTSQGDRPTGRRQSVGAVYTMSEPGDEPSAGGDGDANVLALSGELDMDAAPLAFTAVADAIQAGDPHVVLDLSGVEFIDSSGLKALVAAHHAALERAVRLEIRAPSNAVRDVLALTGLAVVFLLEDDPT